MSRAEADTRSLVFERQLPHPPEKVWRALTENSLLEQWFMQSDFLPVVGTGSSSAPSRCRTGTE